MSSAICFNLDQSKILSSGNGLTLILLFTTIHLFCKACRARSVCTYVHSDLAIHSLLLLHPIPFSPLLHCELKACVENNVNVTQNICLS